MCIDQFFRSKSDSGLKSSPGVSFPLETTILPAAKFTPLSTSVAKVAAIAKSTPVSESTSVAKFSAMEKSAIVSESISTAKFPSIAKSTPVAEFTPFVDLNPVAQSAPVAEFTPVVEFAAVVPKFALVADSDCREEVATPNTHRR
jgi:hypothetical protein